MVLGVAQRDVDEGLVHRADHARHGVPVLGVDLAAHEHVAQRGRHGDREQRRREHHEGLGERERAKEPPRLPFEPEDRDEARRDDEQREEDRGRHLARGLGEQFRAVLFGEVRGRVLELLVGGLDHHDLGVDGGPHGDGDAAERHDRRGHAEEVHRDERREHHEGQREDRQERAPQVQEEEHDHRGDDDHLLGERAAERVDGALDELRAVVHGHHLDALGQRPAHLAELRLDAVDDLPRVLAVAHHHDARHHLPAAVEVGGAAADLRPHPHRGHVAHAHRGAPRRPAQHHGLEVARRADPAAASHEILALRHLDEPTADLAVGLAERARDVLPREAEGAQPVGVERHLVLGLVAPDGRHLGHAGHRRERVAEGVVLVGAERGEVVAPRAVDEGVLVDPADARGVGADARRDVGRQPVARRRELLEHARAGPLEVGALFEDHVDEGHPEHGLRAHVGHLREPEEGRHQGVGHLVFDHRGGAAHPLGVDDHLRVGEVGDGVEADALHRRVARHAERHREEEHQRAVLRAEGEEADHHRAPPLRAARRRLSESTRKAPRDTTRSPSARPSSTSQRSPMRAPGANGSGLRTTPRRGGRRRSGLEARVDDRVARDLEPRRRARHVAEDGLAVHPRAQGGAGVGEPPGGRARRESRRRHRRLDEGDPRAHARRRRP